MHKLGISAQIAVPVHHPHRWGSLSLLGVDQRELGKPHAGFADGMPVTKPNRISTIGCSHLTFRAAFRFAVGQQSQDGNEAI